MFPLNKEQINELKEENLEALCYLDSQGLLLGINESFTEYKSRLLKISENKAAINSELKVKDTVCIDKKTKIKAKEQVPYEKYAESNLALTRKYSFQINWIPAFFYKNIGLLAGACTLTFESGLSLILISKNFKYKNKWLNYSLQEMITHELCHAARTPIKDDKLEEFFAYSLSSSPIRKYFGNCFRSPLDSLLLLSPIFLLFCVQIYNVYYPKELSMPLFWLLIFVYPFFLFIRNQLSVNIYKKAKNYLIKSKFSAQLIPSILFRCDYDEIKKIGGFYNNSPNAEEWFSKKINMELRWKIISKRFFPQIGTFDHTKI